MKQYNKLVRDKIPDIIKQKGGEPKTHIATPEEYDQKVREKLQEEVKEFLDSNNSEELADIMEVVYAIGGRLGTSKDALETLRKRKADERGGFEQGIILEES
jgi:predicted house-cleaning noncanonical NTP pyrophosphatase (MazG superfamily)